MAQFPIFDGYNFSLWYDTMHTYFIEHDLFKYLQYECDLSIKENFRKDNEVLGLLFCTMNDDVFSLVSELTTSKSVWDLLISTYGGDIPTVFDETFDEYVRQVTKQVDHDSNTNEDSYQMQDHLVAQGFDPPFEGEHHEDESYEIMKNESNDMTTAQSIKITKVQVQSLPNVPVDKVQIIATHLHPHQVSSTYSLPTSFYDKETYVIIKVRSVDKDQDWKFKVFFKYQFHKFKEKIQVFVLTLRGRMLGVMSSLNSPSSTRIVHLNLDM